MQRRHAEWKQAGKALSERVYSEEGGALGAGRSAAGDSLAARRSGGEKGREEEGAKAQQDNRRMGQ